MKRIYYWPIDNILWLKVVLEPELEDVRIKIEPVDYKPKTCNPYKTFLYYTDDINELCIPNVLPVGTNKKKHCTLYLHTSGYLPKDTHILGFYAINELADCFSIFLKDGKLTTREDSFDGCGSYTRNNHSPLDFSKMPNLIFEIEHVDDTYYYEAMENNLQLTVKDSNNISMTKPISHSVNNYEDYRLRFSGVDYVTNVTSLPEQNFKCLYVSIIRGVFIIQLK